MKQRESGAEYRKRRRIKYDKMKSYPKITGFMNTVDVTPGPAFPTAAAAQTATKELPFFESLTMKRTMGNQSQTKDLPLIYGHQMKSMKQVCYQIS